MFEDLADFFAVEGKGEVVRYLEQNEKVVGFLQPVHDLVRKFFPAEKLGLRFSVDPEDSFFDGLRMSIEIGPELEVEEVWSIFNRLSNEWAGLIAGKIEGEVGLDLEFL